MQSIAAAKAGGAFANLKTGVKIMVGFAAILVLLVGVGANSYFAFLEIEHDFDTFEQRVKVVGLARELDREVLDLRRYVREFGETGDEEDYKHAREAAKSVQDRLNEMKATIKHPARAKLVADIAVDVADYLKGFERAAALKREEHKIVAETLDPSGTQLRKEFETLIAAGAVKSAIVMVSEVMSVVSGTPF